jgi:hypothetical protein
MVIFPYFFRHKPAWASASEQLPVMGADSGVVLGTVTTGGGGGVVFLSPRNTNHAPPPSKATTTAANAAIRTVWLFPLPAAASALDAPLNNKGFPHSVQTKSIPLGISITVWASANAQLPKLEHLPDFPDFMMLLL